MDTWDFWIDRGGTFTDVVARRPDGSLAAHKLLSENPEAYRDAAVQGIRDLLGLAPGAPIPAGRSAPSRWAPRSRPTRCSSARASAPCSSPPRASATRSKIGYQARPKIFARHIIKPEILFERVIEVDERVRADGTVEAVPDLARRPRRPRAGAAPTASRPWRSCSCMPITIKSTSARSPRWRAAWAFSRSRSATRCRR